MNIVLGVGTETCWYPCFGMYVPTLQSKHMRWASCVGWGGAGDAADAQLIRASWLHSLPSGRNKQPKLHQIQLWSRAVHRLEESSKMSFQLFGLLRLYCFAARLQQRADRRCWLELDGKCSFTSLLRECQVKERRGVKEERGLESLVGFEFSGWPEFQHTCNLNSKIQLNNLAVLAE